MFNEDKFKPAAPTKHEENQCANRKGRRRPLQPPESRATASSMLRTSLPGRETLQASREKSAGLGLNWPRKGALFSCFVCGLFSRGNRPPQKGGRALLEDRVAF